MATAVATMIDKIDSSRELEFLHKFVTIFAGLALLAVVGCTVPSFRRLVQRLGFRGKHQHQIIAEQFEDRDGLATKDSKRAYSFAPQKVVAGLLSLLGMVDSLALSILTTQRPLFSLFSYRWIHSTTWFLLIIQAIALSSEPLYLQRFQISAFAMSASFLLLICSLIDALFVGLFVQLLRPSNISLTLEAVQIILAFGLVLTYGLVPRRPDVFRGEQVVDRQYTVSILSRATFAWPSPILRFARKNKGLEIEHLPELDYSIRSETLQYNYERMGKKDKLWKSLLSSHKSAFLAQGILVTITSLTNFLPQIALFFILRALEDRDHGRNATSRLWMCVLGLGVSIVISSWLESWLFFVCYSRIGQPVFQQLAAVIFGKSMARKDVKGTSSKLPATMNGDASEPTDTLPTNQVTGSTARSDDDVDEEQKTRQSTINLVGVDSYRISNFATYVYIFPGTVLKLVLAFGFLVKLIGWIPLLAGLVVPAIVTPVNALASKRYARAQDDLMKIRDKKMAVVTEALQGIRQIKFSALENSWQRKILEIRHRELQTQWRVFGFDTTLIAIWVLGPVMLAAVALGAYAVMYGSLDASIAFTTVSVFEALEMTLAVIPELIADYLDARISATRIQKYLDSAEKQDYIQHGAAIKFQNATLAWPAEELEAQTEDQFRLSNLNIEFPNKELSVIFGRTGTGKSLLLASILGEADLLKGKVYVPQRPPVEARFDEQANQSNWYLPGTIAYVAQIPWIQNATIKDNILFGLPLDRIRYKKTISACALEKDLEMLTDGEMTDIGANGINLSGGQKWRVSFARALYSRAEILILDDIFSAVDAHVGRHLFEDALTGELGQERTRILVTHHVALCLPRTKYSVLLGNGSTMHAGTVEQLRRSGDLQALLAQDADEDQRQAEQLSQAQSAVEVDDGGRLQQILSGQSQYSRRRSSLAKQDTPNQPKPTPKKFTEDESRERGAIKAKVYGAYIKASGGYGHWILVVIAFTICLGVTLGRSWWISVWTRTYKTESPSSSVHTGSRAYLFHQFRQNVASIQVDPNLWFYLGIYLAWSIALCIVSTSRYFLVFLGSIRASKDLFQSITYSVLRAPLRWLDTVPVGRVLNRFTADFNMIDSHISLDLAFMMHNTMQVVSVIIAGIFVSAGMIGFALLLLAVCMYYAMRYLNGAREVKRLESTCKSPIFESFGAALAGISTIRAFDKTEVYIQRMYRKIDTYAQAYWHLWLFNRWMSFRLNMVGAMFATVTAALIVSLRGIDASLGGFALSFALEYTVALVWALRQYANVELDMNAIERVVEYSNVGIEKQTGNPVPASWPAEGRLEVSDLVVGYAEDLPPVLKGLSFSVEPNQRVGVVGRTGAGKSSLTLALFRFLEARKGVVLIDGLDVSTIRLEDLRSRLAIIPQDPVLFSGTVRSNLDAFEEHGDSELRDALERVHLVSGSQVESANDSGTATPVTADTNRNIFRHLDSAISEGGLNLSQGQRQLLCLARAIVSRPKIMVLDEATSAVDMETDALIQRSIREEFQDSTLIVIAHRLSTIADFDKILVMGEGRVLEFDEPRVLMEKVGGEFRRMVEESGERDDLETIICGTKDK